MQLKFRCEYCSQKLEADSTVSSAEVQCPACEQFITVPEIRLQPGVVIGDFAIEKPLGSGGMGDVFLARQQSMGRMVALKILPEAMSRKKDKCERFMQEIRLTASLEHPNIVTAHSAGEDNGYYYMAMTFIDGENLEDMTERKGQLDEKFCLDIANQLADALDYAWKQKQILHRDLKPANIMVDESGRLRLLDMGIAKHIGSDNNTHLTMSGEFIGTPNFASPELARGENDLDCRSDIFSFGATLYTCLTGKKPFVGNSFFNVVNAIINTNPTPIQELNPDVSESMSQFISLLMEKSREKRPVDWAQVKEEIRRVKRGEFAAKKLSPKRIKKKKLKTEAKLPEGLHNKKANSEPKKKPFMLYAFSGCALVLVLLFGLFAGAVILNNLNQSSQSTNARMDLNEAQNLIDEGEFEQAEHILTDALSTYRNDIPEYKHLKLHLERARLLPEVISDLDNAIAMLQNKNPAEARSIINNRLGSLSSTKPIPNWKKEILDMVMLEEAKMFSQHRTKELLEVIMAKDVNRFINFIHPESSNQIGGIILKQRVRKFMNEHPINNASGFVQISPDIDIMDDYKRAIVPYYLVSNGKREFEGSLKWERARGKWLIKIKTN